MPSLEQQENYLRKLRKGSSIDASIHPEWTITDWLYYWLKFPLEYSLIFLFVVPACIISFLFAFYDFIKNLFITNNASIKNDLKDNLNNNPQFNLNFNTNNNNKHNEILSIIIPCYNESNNILPTLMYLDIHCSDPSKIEILLVDGNSSDIVSLRNAVNDVLTYLNIKESQIKIINKPNISGRGTCQNVGVAECTGKYLLFIHADTIVPKHYDKIIRETLDCKLKKQVLLGSFTFAIDRSLMEHPVPGIGWVELFARVRNTLLSLPYGDQGLFIKKDRFIEIGGFKWIPFLDDIEFVMRCREIAAMKKEKIYIDSNYAYCSPRRWQTKGVAKNTVRNQWLLFLYTRVKLTPERIYQIYYGRKL